MSRMKMILCQYPKSDNIHFYDKRSLEMLKIIWCQYPKSDNIHFYPKMTFEYEHPRKVSIP